MTTTTTFSLKDPVRYLKGVGPKLAERFKAAGVECVADLLFHLPTRYEDRTQITPLSSLEQDAACLVEARVVNATVIGRQRRQMVVYLEAQGHKLTLRFFHFSATQYQQFRQSGALLRCYGVTKLSKRHTWEMIHPEYRLVPEEGFPLETTLTPVYSTLEGLSQNVWRRVIIQALSCLEQSQGELDDFPQAILERWSLLPLKAAILCLHRPEHDKKNQKAARHRLVFEELLAHHLCLLQLRSGMRREKARPFVKSASLNKSFLQKLPFQLTSAQARVVKEIQEDLGKSAPMMRLLQGDVGSGKTIVAALAALSVVGSGQQVAVMAPTELLAEQHRAVFTRWFEPLGIKVVALCGGQTPSQQKATQAAIAEGACQLIIGTHALFQQKVAFANLGFIVIDEQHRFGVHQRLALREKGMRAGVVPHQLVMTATPIPRTLAMLAYSDLDVSVIDELPAGRKPIKTVLIEQHQRQQLVERLKEYVKEGRQVYWVCPLIEETEHQAVRAATSVFEELNEQLTGLSIGLVHGRMKGDAKQETMQAFSEGKLLILVATTVIEVGVDVPNASVMVIDHAERLGLAQLHQLRGRVGRGGIESHCVLLYQNPLSEEAAERLAVIRRSQDGFAIAEKDLAMRGPGEFLGERQAGLMRFKIVNWVEDCALIDEVQAAGEYLSAHYPNYVSLIIKRWMDGDWRFAAA